MLFSRTPRADLLDAVDEGRLTWVWDVSLGGYRRDLRFLLQELDGVVFGEADQVIDSVIRYPGQVEIPACRVAASLALAPVRLARLAQHNLLVVRHIGPRRTVVSRASLVAFLRARLVGAAPPTPARGPGAQPLTQSPAASMTYAQR